MPRKPLKPCSHPGCPNLTERTYCKEHEREENRNYEKYSRGKEHRKRYGNHWSRLRNAYMAEHPFCERCMERGMMVKAEEVHHKVPLNDGGKSEWSNLMSLCRKCHAEIHGTLGSRTHRKTVYSYEGNHHS